ncbi:hypothetical protein VTK56DRAFT_493 [Thermocarpiscus australiensis]
MPLSPSTAKRGHPGSVRVVEKNGVPFVTDGIVSPIIAGLEPPLSAAERDRATSLSLIGNSLEDDGVRSTARSGDRTTSNSIITRHYQEFPMPGDVSVRSAFAPDNSPGAPVDSGPAAGGGDADPVSLPDGPSLPTACVNSMEVVRTTAHLAISGTSKPQSFSTRDEELDGVHSLGEGH